MTSVVIGRKKLNKEIPEMMFLIQQQRKKPKNTEGGHLQIKERSFR